MLINGTPGSSISIHDRGLLYGDGVFRTLRIRGGQPLHWAHHYRKLLNDCGALLLACPPGELLLKELQQLATQQPESIAKIIVTRGEGERGYPIPAQTVPTRILSLSPLPQYPSHFYKQGVKLRVCELRLGHQPHLAGIKHLNRLENVLATTEWADPDIPEGLLLDSEGNVIECTRSNLFAVFGAELATSDLTRCGVAGVQRERVLEWAAQQGIPCHIRHLGLQELRDADELFLVNSIIGLWPVRELQGKTWHSPTLSMRIQEWLEHAY